MLFYYCMQSRSLQQYEDNPLSFSVCQDTNLPWFLSAVVTAASVTESKMHIDQLPLHDGRGLRRPDGVRDLQN